MNSTGTMLHCNGTTLNCTVTTLVEYGCNYGQDNIDSGPVITNYKHQPCMKLLILLATQQKVTPSKISELTGSGLSVPFMILKIRLIRRQTYIFGPTKGHS